MGHYVSQKEGFKLVGAATLKALSLKLWRLVQGGRRADPCPRTTWVGKGCVGAGNTKGSERSPNGGICT